VTKRSNGQARQKGATATSTNSNRTTTAGPQNAMSMSDRFREIADHITRAVGSPIALITAISLILLWAISGPIFGFSDSWQLVINTTTTIITFLMVFVIQTSQNRDGRAIQVKLDELIRANADARNVLMKSEKGSEEQLNALEQEFQGTADEPPPT
jgi:low affinity Fe/Cu permease